MMKIMMKMKIRYYIERRRRLGAQKYNFDSNSLMVLVMIWLWMYISHPSDQTPISSKIDPKLMLYRPLAKVKLTPI